MEPKAAASAPLVSVVIRSIGRPELGEALASVARQTYPSIEVVVVNAMGPDHPPVPTTCGSFPVRVASTGKHLARSRAANLGLDSARGTFVIFLDDDDWWEASHVAALANALERDPGGGLAYAGVKAVNERGECVLVLNRPFSAVMLRAGNFIPLHAAMFRRLFVEQGCRFDEDFAVYEDWDFFLQLAERTKFLHVDQISATYRVGGTSGVGPQADAGRSREGRASVLDKWRRVWTGADLDETLEGLNEEIRVRERALGERGRELAERERTLAERERTLGERDRSLAERDRSLAERDRELASQTIVILDLERRNAGLLGSRSWRYTAPLRRLSAWLGRRS